MRPKKIIWIVVDALRADHLGCYGYKRNTSPNIDRLAKEGILFNWAFSSSSYTFPAHSSMFTGKYPSNNSFGFDEIPIHLDRDNEIFLSEILGSNNYETAIFVSNSILVTHCKLDIGFDYIDKNFDDMTARKGKETNREIFEWLEDHKNKDFFLFVHYFDTHGPYIDQKPYDEMFTNDELYKSQQEKLVDKVVKYYQMGLPDYLLINTTKNADGGILDFEKDLRHYIARYDGGVRYCDDTIGELINKLKELDLYDDTLIILTADHGESLGESGNFTHGNSLSKELINVPLIIKSHKDWMIEPKNIDVQVSIVDIMPSILDLIGYDHYELELDGESIRELIEIGNSDKLYNRIITSEIELQEAKIDKEYIHIIPKNKEFSIENIRYTVDPDPMIKKEFLESFKELWKKEFLFNYRKDPECKNNLVVKWTGERFLPWIEDSQIHYEHLHRYAFSSQFIKGKKVLDLACGEGYGSYMLSNGAEYVIGIDIDKAIVEHSRNRYIVQNLEFIQGSILEIPIQGNEEFDVIICFEGIEHIEKHEKFLSEVKRLLKKDGIFIVSSPNKKTYSDDSGYINPFHKKELYFGEFKSLLNKYFEDFIFFGQKIYDGSNIWPLPPYSYSEYKEFIIERYDKEFNFLEVYKKVPQYFIAIASDKKLYRENYVTSNLLDISNVLTKDLEKQVGILTHDTNVRDSQISELNNTLKVRDSQISELNNTLKVRDSQISELNNTLKVRDSQISELNNTLKVRDSQISELNNTLKVRDSQIWTMETSLRDKNVKIAELTRDLQDIQQSIIWRSVMSFHKRIIEKLLPHGTRRKGIYDLALKSGRIIMNDGMGSLWWHYKERRRVKKLEGQTKVQTMEIQSNIGIEYPMCISSNTEDMSCILVVDRSLPTYDRSSGSLRMYSILSILCNLGYNVTFLPDDLHKIEPYTSELQKMGVNVLGGNIDVESYLKKTGHSFSSVILSRPEQAYKYIPLIRAYAINSAVIYDTVDIHWLRLERTASITGKASFINQANHYKSLELFNALCSDIVLTVTEDEKNLLLKELPGIDIEVIPNIHEVFRSDIPFGRRKDIIFVGGFLHQPNEDAVIYFVEKIFPLIKEKIGSIKLFVVGSDPSDNLLKLSSKDIIVTGYVKDLTKYFEECRVFVSPLRYGAGMKGKIGQSMSYGLPVVTTSIGAEGIKLVDGFTALIADDPNMFADAVIKLYTDELLWNKISEESVKHIQKNYSKEIVGNTIHNLFNKIEQNGNFNHHDI